MFIPGLCAISFRKHNIEDIVRAASKSGLSLIEWGSDISVPSGDTAVAISAGSLSDAARLRSPSYGSYFKLGLHNTDELLPLIANAKILGSSIIRIWGHNTFVSPENKDTWDMLVREARNAADLARTHGITLALECHNNTVTAHYENALRFLGEVGCDNLRMYWQPNHLLSYEYNIASIRALRPYVEVIHAFNWNNAGRYPLALGKETWLNYLGEFSDIANRRDIPVLLEFMPDGEITSLATEAGSLLEILKISNSDL